MRTSASPSAWYAGSTNWPRKRRPNSSRLKGSGAWPLRTSVMGWSFRRRLVFPQSHRGSCTDMKATWNGATIAESDDTVVVEGNHYFPEASLKREYVTFSNHRSSCPWKGQAHYYSLMVDGELNENAVWYYPEPSEAAREIKGRVAFWKGVKVS